MKPNPSSFGSLPYDKAPHETGNYVRHLQAQQLEVHEPAVGALKVNMSHEESRSHEYRKGQEK